ncbi:MAG TPA: FAD-dependent oxidoreductase [Desulfotignum sp.]|nr:FAD-dependent oxidoreductase [Desulfotignum sp.]
MIFKKTCDVAIVGGGVSGLAAAAALADQKLDVLVLDENPRVGGRVFRTMPWPGNASRIQKIFPGRPRLLDKTATSSVTVLNHTQVMGIDKDLEILAEKDRKEIISIRPRMVLAATGARETFVPFPGWTLPGVMAAGGAQTLMKGTGVLPGQHMVLAGMGPFLSAVAGLYLKKRGRPAAILDFAKPADTCRLLVHGFRQGTKILEGARNLAGILLAGVPCRHRTMVVAAQGSRELEKVVAARVDSLGRIMEGTRITYKTECLATGWGFVPNLELPMQAGCGLIHDPDLGGWVVAVTHDCETSIPGIFAAGEITGIAGASMSMIEGELAALGILKKLGRNVDAHRMAVLQRQRKQSLSFSTWFNRLHRVPDAVFSAIPDTVTICRCEHITMGEIKTAVEKGYDTPAMLKKALRCGMGLCQGRTCGPIVNRILAALTRRSAGAFPFLPVRTPVKPISVRSFLQ